MSTDLICTDVPSERVAPSLMLAFLCREHRELLRQIAQTGSHSDSEELEQELEHLARKMESKEDQISKLQKHQDRVRALCVSNKPAFLLRKLPVLRRQNQSPHRCSITSAWPSSWECGGTVNKRSVTGATTHVMASPSVECFRRRDGRRVCVESGHGGLKSRRLL